MASPFSSRHAAVFMWSLKWNNKYCFFDSTSSHQTQYSGTIHKPFVKPISQYIWTFTKSDISVQLVEIILYTKGIGSYWLVLYAYVVNSVSETSLIKNLRLQFYLRLLVKKLQECIQSADALWLSCTVHVWLIEMQEFNDDGQFYDVNDTAARLSWS